MHDSALMAHDSRVVQFLQVPIKARAVIDGLQSYARISFQKLCYEAVPSSPAGAIPSSPWRQLCEE